MLLLDARAVERSFFRIVTTDPPTVDDFRSHQELGIPNLDPANYELWSGISVYGTLHQARKKALQYPSKGRYLAELRIPEGTNLTLKRTGRNNHFTIWGAKEDLLDSVVRVISVEESEYE